METIEEIKLSQFEDRIRESLRDQDYKTILNLWIEFDLIPPKEEMINDLMENISDLPDYLKEV